MFPNSEVLTNWMVDRLQTKGRLEVRASDKQFWILAKGTVPRGYAISKNGKRPAPKAFAGEFSKYRLLSASEVWNWLQNLDLVSMPSSPSEDELKSWTPADRRRILRETKQVQKAWHARGRE